MSGSNLEAPSDDAISLTLSKFEPEYLLTIMQGLKNVIDQNPEQGREMLGANQDLTYAVLQAELLMGLVDESVVMEAMNAAQVAAGQANVQSKEETLKPATESDVSHSSLPEQEVKDPLAALDPQQAEMIRQVIALSEEQLSLLPSEQQEQVRALKKQYS